MKMYQLLFFVISISLRTAAQPAIQWQATYGGSEYDEARTIVKTTDGGYLVAGDALSDDFDVTGHILGFDTWVIKLSSSGALEWQKIIGGTNNEYCAKIKQTPDNGYVLVGKTLSNDGDFSFNRGSHDLWVVKMSESGQILWSKTYGGSYLDLAKDVVVTPDNNYIVAGSTASSDYDVTSNHGSDDFWVLKLDSQGEIIWQKTFGGSNSDISSSIARTSDDGFILTGETKSNDGEVAGNNGNVDYWLLKLSEKGEIEWQKTLGGIGADFGISTKETIDGGYAVLGYSGSFNSGMVTGHHGGFDIWFLKLDGQGNIIWTSTLGGSLQEWSSDFVQNNLGEYYILGSAQSTNGNVIGNDGGMDVWVIKLDQFGNLVWQNTFGGTEPEDVVSNILLDGENLLFCGYTWSNNGDVLDNNGRADFWVVKLAPASVTTNTPQNLPLQITPNPAQQFVSFELPNDEQAQQVFLSDLLGREILRLNQPATQQIDLSSLPRGVYVLSVITIEGQRFSGKFRRE